MVKLPIKEMIIYARQERHDHQGVSEGLPNHRGRAHVRAAFGLFLILGMRFCFAPSISQDG